MNPITRRRILGLFSFLPFLSGCTADAPEPRAEPEKLPLFPSPTPEKKPQPTLAPPRIAYSTFNDPDGHMHFVLDCKEARLRSPFRLRWLHRLWGCDSTDHTAETVTLVDHDDPERRVIEWPMTLYQATYDWLEQSVMLWPLLTEAYCVDFRRYESALAVLHLDQAFEFTARERELWMAWITILFGQNDDFFRACHTPGPAHDRYVELYRDLAATALKLA